MKKLALLLVVGTCTAKISFNTPNDHDASGNPCPPPFKINRKCPQVCVSSLDQCPQASTPDPCPPHQQYCPDALCHPGTDFATACAGTVPVCQCPGSKATALPCKNDGFRADRVPSLPINQQEDALYATCDALLSKNTSSTSPPFLLRCPVQQDRDLDLYSTHFLIFYVWLGVQVLVLFLYWVRVRLRSKNQSSPKFLKRRNLFIPKKSSTNDQAYFQSDLELQNLCSPPPRDEADNTLRFKGYKRDLIGTLVYFTLSKTSVGLLFVLLTLTLDYYGVFSISRKDSWMLFVNHDILSRVFIVVWHVTAVWFVGLKLTSSSAITYFSTPTGLDDATTVMIESPRVQPIKLADMGGLVEFIWKVQNWFTKRFLPEYQSDLVKVQITPSGTRFIEYKCIRYTYSHENKTFLQTNITIGPLFSDLHAQSSGLSTHESINRIEYTGPNAIAFPETSMWKGLMREFSGYFYIYQMMSLWIWYYYAYYYMGMVLTGVIVASGVVKVFVSLNAQKRVLRMARFHGEVCVKRDGGWMGVGVDQLVVGDVIEIQPSEHPLPVDLILISGGAVTDESSLTGEALPVSKFPIRNEHTPFDPTEHKVYCLFAGCKILQTQTQTTGIVMCTGASTLKGKLVKDILYPVPISFVFTEHLKMVFLILVGWGLAMLVMSVEMLGADSIDSWFYGMFTISQILSPLLPAVLVIGQSVAATRLRRNGILCVDLQRITLGGKVKVFAFDKTGTLTKEGLEFKGVKQSFRQAGGLVSQFGDISEDGFEEDVVQAMSVAHSLTMVGGEFVGNFVDIEMFKATGSTLKSDQNTMIYLPSRTEPLSIIKRYEFVHAVAYMSVVVGYAGTVKVFLKGSFERIKELVNPSSIPPDYDTQAQQLAASGYYVMALASKIIPEYNDSLPRHQLEIGSEFLGFMVFRNELKSDTAIALKELKQGGCRLIMITGDNAQTAIYIAKQCGMIPIVEGYSDDDRLVILGDVVEGQVEWKNVEDDSVVDVEEVITGPRVVELAVTGKAFNVLVAKGMMRRLLLHTRIFARMSPLDKVKAVQLHMEVFVTAMCGDGGNDAGALKASHCGIALCESESSVVSHFSSNNRSIRTCVRLLRECRCSLDVSFSSYKSLLMYGEILAFIGLIQYYFVVNMSQAMWVLIDGTTVPLSWALTMSKPAKNLSPTRPTARLLGYETVISVTGQIFISVVFMIIAIITLFQQPWFLCHEFEGFKADMRKWWELADSYESEVSGLLACFQIIFAAATFNLGSTYRKGFFKNIPFIGIFIGIFTILSYITLAPPNSIGCLFRINCGGRETLKSLGYPIPFYTPTEFYSNLDHNVLPVEFRYKFWMFVCINFVTVMIFEGMFVLGPVRKMIVKMWPGKKIELNR